ncbi:hypothetical protein RND81_12G065500 [Saponaria officinalis]|uniref:S-protein homolog n=1 Tax=Saponaria officinalis TaxID=3572 RepID=A0AAW1H7C2_SAPOF
MVNDGKHKGIILLFILALLQTNFSPTIAYLYFGMKYYVYIDNKITTYKNTVGIRCQSGDEDIGFKYLKDNDDKYNFNFRLNFWGTTLYFCHFYWGRSDFSYVVFDMGSYEECRDGASYWEIREDGLYSRCYKGGSGGKYTWKKRHNWP